MTPASGPRPSPGPLPSAGPPAVPSLPAAPGNAATPAGTWSGIWRQVLRNPLGLAALIFLAAVALCSFSAAVAAPYGPLTADLAHALALPSGSHLLGTDTLGRDVLSRLMYAGQPSLTGAAQAIGVALLLGVPTGLFIGYSGGWADGTVTPAARPDHVHPQIIVLLMALAVFGNDMTFAMVTLGVLFAPGLARVARGATIGVREELFVAAARVSGLSRAQIIRRHVLPAVAGPVIVNLSLLAAAAILAQAGLNFLGLGVQAPNPSWGGMVAEASGEIQQQPWLLVPSGLVIALTVLALVLFGDAVRDATAHAYQAVPARGRRRAARPAAAATVGPAGTVTARATAPGPPADGDSGGDGPLPLLRLRDLTVAFPAGQDWTTVVDAVSFDVQAGEVVGLVGESGCGKTMTALAVLGLIPGGGQIRGGQVWFGGTDLAGLPERRLRGLRGRRIGFIAQEPMVSLDPAYTVGNQLAEAVRQHTGCPRAAARDRALQLLEMVEIREPRDVARRYPHQISGGMAQRVVDRPGAGRGTGPADRGRADHGARRHRPGRDPRPAPLAAAAVRAGRAPGHPRLGRGRRRVQPRRGHVRGTGGGAGRGAARVRAAAASLHQWTAAFRPAPGGRRAAAGHHPRNGAGTGPVGPRLPVRRPLPAREAGLHASPGPAAGTSPGPVQPLPVSRPRPCRGPMNEQQPILQLSHLTVRFRRGRSRPPLVAVDDVSLDIQPGETVGLVGESGSGKTTLGRAVLGLTAIADGSVSFGGEDITRAGTRQRRRLAAQMQAVFQDPYSSLNPRRTVGQTLAEPFLAGGRLDRGEQACRVTAALARVGLPADAAARYPASFSGGQRQRIAIARALMLAPRFVICDEAVSALDLSAQAQVLNLLMDLQAELGLSYLFISHDMAVVRYMSHRITVLYQGQVMESGPASAVAQAPAHPYTQALLDAVPVPDPELQPRRRAAREQRTRPGTGASAGCPFAPRCPHAIERCRAERPALEVTARQTIAACHRHRELTGQPALHDS